MDMKRQRQISNDIDFEYYAPQKELPTLYNSGSYAAEVKQKITKRK